VLADVCDKGVGAALFMALIRSLLRSQAQLHAGGSAAKAARSIVALTNDYIARTHGRSNMFATVFFGLLDPENGDLAWVNGGHEPPMLRRRSGEVERLLPSGPAVGALPDMAWEPREVRLDPGDLLLAFTDGVTEERAPAGAFYGEARLLGLVREGGSPEALLSRIEADVAAHRATGEPTDDLTMLAVQRVPAGG
jgi:serine phosphatase RsbU (regulator of sigma subunit)